MQASRYIASQHCNRRRSGVPRFSLTKHSHAKHRVFDDTPGIVYTSTAGPTPATQVSYMAPIGRRDENESVAGEEGVRVA